jgi:hypothetical protein
MMEMEPPSLGAWVAGAPRITAFGFKVRLGASMKTTGPAVMIWMVAPESIVSAHGRKSRTDPGLTV